jgi:hypothetical protein
MQPPYSATAEAPVYVPAGGHPAVSILTSVLAAAQTDAQ